MEAAVNGDEVCTLGFGYFNPDEYLVNILRRAATNLQDILVVGAHGEIVVLGGRNKYVAQVESIKLFCLTPASQFTIEVLQPGDPRRPAQPQQGRDLGELIWKAAFFASDGRLMKGCYRDDVVQLVHWPNLTRLPITPNTVRICALLSRYPTSITLASRLLKVDVGELYQIYSAAKCAGLTRALNRKPEEPMLSPHKNQGILALLFEKLIGL